MADDVATRETLNLAAAGPDGNNVSVAAAGPVAFTGPNSLVAVVSAKLDFNGSSGRHWQCGQHHCNETFSYTPTVIGGIDYTINASGNATHGP